MTANNIARWDGTNWFSLGSGVNGIVRSLTTRGNDVFVGGSFTRVGSISATNIAKWDGTMWSALGRGIVGEAVDALTFIGTNLYAAGRFRLAGGMSATNIARWDGQRWVSLGLGVRNFEGPGSENGHVRAMAGLGKFLFVGGNFRLAGGIQASNIAKWDGICWSALGGGINDSVFLAAEVYALNANGTDLYVGGGFRSASGIATTNIAKWDGSNWSALGSGVSGGTAPDGGGAVWALISSGSDLFSGGFFTLAGRKPSAYFGIWHIPHALSISQTENRVTVRWPATGTNFQLEAKGDLNCTNWSEVSQPPTTHDGQCVVTEPNNGANRFYRLRRKP